MMIALGPTIINVSTDLLGGPSCPLGKNAVCGAYVVRMWCVWDLMWCVCGAYVVRMWCVYGAYVARMWCVCHAYVMRM